MSNTPRVSVVIPVADGPQQLPRLMAGLSVQTLDHADMEVRLVHDGSLDVRATEVWGWMLRPARLELDHISPEDRGAGADLRTTLLLAGLRRARGRVLLPLFPKDRVLPQTLKTLAQTLEQRPGLAHGNWLRLGPLSGQQRGSSCASKLRRRNEFGPRPALSREAFEAGVRPRPGLPLGWDLAVQAVQAGFPLLKAPGNLLTLSSILPDWKDHKEERGRARLVLANPGFFASATLAWAMAVLRRESWALGSTPGRIPQPREAARLKDRHVRAMVREERGWPPEIWAELLPAHA